MKKTIFLIAMALIAIVAIRCKEEAEIPALKFEINASTDETLTERGVNDNAVINFEFKADYDYATAPLSFKIDYDKQGILKLGNEELTKDTTYNLDKPELSLSYVGKEEGKHTIKVYFFNDKGIHILKEIEIPYAKYNFAVAVTGDETVYQGETKEYKLTITPENATVKDNYKIKFISYDENDPALQKSYVAFNGIKIDYNKAYEIADITKEQKINLKSFHSGAKKLIYIIINSSSEKQEKISQEVKAAEIAVKDLNFNKLTTNTLDDNLQLRGFITKVPALSNKTIFYRTWIVDVPNEQKEGVENTDNTYKDFTLPNNNEFVINVKVKKYGTYKYMLQFKDEFGNETEPRSFEIKAIDKNFEIEQKVNTNLENVVQGQKVELLFNVKEMESTNEEYQVQFLSFDEKDVNLQKTKITFNNAQIQLNKWYTVKKGTQNLIAINTFYAGSKKLTYQVKNSIYSKEKELSINIKKTSISIKNLSLNTDKIYIDKEFKLEGKIEKTYSENKNIEYKTWLSAGDNTKFKDLANTYKNYELLKDNMFSLTFKAAEVGRYVLKIQAKDEFGNESEIKEFQINVIGNEFAVEQKLRSDINNLTQGQEVQIDLEVKEGHNTNEQFQIQFLSFDPSDIYLQKAKIKLNGQNNIQLNKWYTLNKNSLNNIALATFNSGNKKLVYQVKNSMYTKNNELSFNVKKATISLNKLSLKTIKGRVFIDETFKVEGTVEKTYPTNKSIEYKTWLSSGNSSNIRELTNTYRGYELSQDNMLSLDFRITNAGNYTLKVQAKDEFGNESEVKEFPIVVKNNDFEIEQIFNSNPTHKGVQQGEETKITLRVKEEYSTNEVFEIQFLDFDQSDPSLQKSKITFNNEIVQLRKWYSFDKNSDNQLKIISFKSGSKELSYEIKNSAYKKGKKIGINVLPETFTLKTFIPFKKIVPNKPFEFHFTVEAKNHNKEVNYLADFKMKVKYNGRTYLAGEKIPIELENGQTKKEFEMEGIVDNPNNSSFDHIHVKNSDNIEKDIWLNTDILTPIKIDRISFFGRTSCTSRAWNPLRGGWYCDERTSVFYTGGNGTNIRIDDIILQDKENVRYKIILTRHDDNGYHGEGEKTIEIILSQDEVLLYRKIHEEKTDADESHIFDDNMRIEVFYKNKKVYEAKNIKGFYRKVYLDENSWNNIQIINITEDKIFYENYDHIAK